MPARRATTFALLAALVVVSVAFAEPRTLHLVERAATDTVTDTGAPGDSVGDLLTWSNDLFDAANTTRLGTNQGFCLRVRVGVAWECTWTNTLADGQITVQGPFHDKGDSILAVIGGTGAYARTRGQMKLHARNPEGSEYDFVFELTD